jgi:hypothetical protein
MTVELKNRARSLLQIALNNTQDDFRDGQWEAIASLIEERSKLLAAGPKGGIDRILTGALSRRSWLYTPYMVNKFLHDVKTNLNTELRNQVRR